MKQLFFYLIFLVFSFLSLAQEIKKDSITQLDEVILFDVLKRNTATGIVPSQTIGAETFENYSPVDVIASINQISGVYALSGALNTNRITIRGVGARTLFGTDKLRLYFNEIPVTNGTGSSIIEAYDLESLSEIEIIKGPKGTAFGTNLGGAIILNSKEARGTSTNFSNNSTFGSYNLFKNALGFMHTDAKLALGLQYGHLETDGYRENNRFVRDGILLNASYILTDKNKIGLLVNHIDYTAQIPSSLGQTAFRENPRQAAPTWRDAKGFEANKYTLFGISFEHKFNEQLENTTSIFYTYLEHYEPRPFGILDEFTNGFGFRTRFSGNINVLGKVTKFSFGAELAKDEYNWKEFVNLYQQNNGNGSLEGNLFADNKEFRRQLNTFGSITFPLSDNFFIQPGLNVNKTYYDFRDLFTTGADNTNAERDFDVIVLPSLALNYTLKGHTLYANVGRGFSNPSLAETLTPDGVINPDITQEKGTNYELGSNLFFMNNKLNILATVYQMNINDLLVAQRVGDDQFVGKNAGKTRHRGVEIDANYRLVIGKSFKANPFISYTFSNHFFVDFVDEDNDYSGNPLTGVPRHRLNSGLQLLHESGFYMNTTHQFVGEIPLLDANTLYSDSFNVFNTRVGYKKQLSTKFSIGTDFGINNIFNTKYAQSVLINTTAFGSAEPRFYYPGNGINYYGSLQLKYQFLK